MNETPLAISTQCYIACRNSVAASDWTMLKVKAFGENVGTYKDDEFEFKIIKFNDKLYAI